MSEHDCTWYYTRNSYLCQSLSSNGKELIQKTNCIYKFSIKPSIFFIYNYLLTNIFDFLNCLMVIEILRQKFLSNVSSSFLPVNCYWWALLFPRYIGIIINIYKKSRRCLSEIIFCNRQPFPVFVYLVELVYFFRYIKINLSVCEKLIQFQVSNQEQSWIASRSD